VDSLLFFSFLFPTELISGIAGPGRDEEPQRGKCPSPDSDPLLWSFAKKLATLSRQFAASANRRFQFHKRSQLFIGVHNETLSIAAMCVSNENR